MTVSAPGSVIAPSVRLYDAPSLVEALPVSAIVGATLLTVTLFVLRNRFHDTGQGVQAWGSGKRYFVAGNSFERVASPIEIDLAGAGSRISEDGAALEDGLAAFQETYGIDIR